MSDLLQQHGDGYTQVLSLRKHVRQSAIYERQYFTLDTAILLFRISLYKITFSLFRIARSTVRRSSQTASPVSRL